MQTKIDCRFLPILGIPGVVCTEGEQRYLPHFFKLSKHVQQLVKIILKFSIFTLESLFTFCEFNIPGVIAFYAFLRQFVKNHYMVDTTIHISCITDH